MMSTHESARINVLSCAFIACLAIAMSFIAASPSHAQVLRSPDLNQDGMVDAADLTRLLSEFGTSGIIASDLNRDGVVDSHDLNQLLANFGAAPEGGTLPGYIVLICECPNGLVNPPVWVPVGTTCEDLNLCGSPSPPNHPDGPDNEPEDPTPDVPDGSGTVGGDPSKDSGNTGSGPNPPPAAPPCAFEIIGPTHLEPGQTAGYSIRMLNGGGWESAEWNVSNAETLLNTEDSYDLPHDGAFLLLVAGDTPGHFTIGVTLIAENSSCSATLGVTINAVDLDIDSDNDDRFAEPERDAEEDEAEDSTGIKVLIVNRHDLDEDRIPDYADGFGHFGPDTHDAPPNTQFVPVAFSFDHVPDPKGATVQFEYSASDPANLTRIVHPVEGFPTSFYEYIRPNGHLRLWKREGGLSRELDDFIPDSVEYDIADLEGYEYLYLEAVQGSAEALEITLRVTLSSGEEFEDTIRVLPFDAVTGLDEPEILGFTIFNGSTSGTPGNDIVIGTDSNDFILTGDGDDIVIAGDGQDQIETGFGSDVVFAFDGGNSILLEPLLPNNADGNVNTNDVIIPAPPGPFTTEQVLVMYRYMYGDNDPWLTAYAMIGGKVQAVRGDGKPFSPSDWDRVNTGHDRYPVIQLEFSLDSPLVAATHMRQQMLKIVASFAFGHEYEKAILAADLFDDMKISTFGDNVEDIQNILDLQQLALQNAIDATVLISNLYVSSVGILSEGADLVITINDFANGDLSLVEAGLAAMPLISAPLVETAAIGRRAILRTDTDQEICRVGDSALHPQSSKRTLRGIDSGQFGVGWIPRPNMIRQATNNDGKIALLLGTAQETGHPNHATICTVLANGRFTENTTEYILLNRSLKTSIGRTDLGVVSNWRPDTIVVQRNGLVDLYEVKSSTDDLGSLAEKLADMQMAIPPSNRGNIFLYDEFGQPVQISDFIGGLPPQPLGPIVPPKYLPFPP